MKHKIEDEKIPMSLLRMAKKCSITFEEVLSAVDRMEWEEARRSTVPEKEESLKKMLIAVRKMNDEDINRTGDKKIKTEQLSKAIVEAIKTHGLPNGLNRLQLKAAVDILTGERGSLK